MRKRWQSKKQPSADNINKLRKEINTTDVLLRLLVQRNITCKNEGEKYFQPSIEQFHSPFLMYDMPLAVDRIILAINRNEHIVIFGDYDVDGTTSVALLYTYLTSNYSNVSYYIPDRFKEGYGISFIGIDEADSRQCKLIVSLDCGIKSVPHIEYAKEKGIDFIICDHHTPGDDLPDAVAILNPKQSSCDYPFKELSGCGIGFKLIQAIDTKLNSKQDIYNYLDLVAISIASDIVDMTGENRVMAFLGIKILNNNPRPGIKALIKQAGIRQSVGIMDLLFKLGPRINAAGRIGSGLLAVEMLIEKDEQAASEKALAINNKNTDRQKFDKEITSKALEMISRFGFENSKSTVLFHKDWHKGVIGIVASRVIEKYYRPTILLTESNGLAVGSARSVEGFNLYNAIKNCDEMLTQWGGHSAAAGLSLPLDKVDDFRQKFEETVSATITEELLTPVINYDLEITLEEITLRLGRSIVRFGPFGPKNNIPLFITRDVRLHGILRKFGNDHLQFSVIDNNNCIKKVIAFGFGDKFEEILNQKSFNICYSVEIDNFRGEENLYLKIKDLQFSIPSIDNLSHSNIQQK